MEVETRLLYFVGKKHKRFKCNFKYKLFGLILKVPKNEDEAGKKKVWTGVVLAFVSLNRVKTTSSIQVTEKINYTLPEPSKEKKI